MITQRIFKHYIFVILGIIYFSFYFVYTEKLYAVMDEIAYGKIVCSYVSALMAALTSYSFFSIILRSTRKFIEALGERRNERVYSILSCGILRFMSYANYIVSLYLGFTLVIIPKEYTYIVNKIVSTIFILIAVLVISSLIIAIFEQRGIFQFRLANSLSKHLSSVIKKILLVALWVIGGITIVSNLGYDVSALITGAGVGGIALALGAQKSLTNVFGAMSIVLNKPFRIGDFVKIDEIEGTVKDIGLSYVTLMELGGHQVMIPNEVIMSRFIQNYSVRNNRKGDLLIQLNREITQKSLEKAVKIIEEVLKKYKKKKEIENFTVFLNNFGESSYDINVRYFSLQFDYNSFLGQRGRMNLDIKKALKKARICIAIPMRNIVVHEKK